MKEQLPFDHQQDTELGAALRRALEPAGHEAFVTRVVAQFSTPRAGSWDILAGWAGRGIAAAAVLALAAGFAAGRMMQPPGSIEEALMAAPADSGTAAAAVVRGTHPPDASIVFAVRP